MCEYIPIISSIIGVTGVICAAFLFHRLAKKRESNARMVVAAFDFREQIHTVVAKIPAGVEPWDNNILLSLPDIVEKTGVEVAKFAPFLIQKNRDEFKKVWISFEEHCKKNIPKALSNAEVIHGGGSFIQAKDKKNFHEHITKLLIYANQI